MKVLVTKVNLLNSDVDPNFILPNEEFQEECRGGESDDSDPLLEGESIEKEENLADPPEPP